MPVDRNVSCRRSRRFSTRAQDIISDDEDDWECAGELLYPDSDSETITPPASQSRSASSIAPTPPTPRVSHARQRPDDHIPRPPNPFIVFRSEYCVWNKQLDSAAVRDHRLVSKLAGQAWALLDDAARQKYVDLAHQKKLLHAQQYPGYAYAPSSRSGVKSKKRKSSDDCDYEERGLQSKRRRSKGGARPLAVVVDFEAGPASPPKRARAAPTSRSSAPSPDFPRSQTPELSPNTSSDSEPILYTPADTSPYLVCNDDGFVPTEEIPPLDLCSPAPPEMNPSQRPSLLDVGYTAPRTLGFKAEIPKETRDERMWFNADGTCNEPITAAPSTFPDEMPIDLNPIGMEFSNSFTSEFGDWIDLDAPSPLH